MWHAVQLRPSWKKNALSKLKGFVKALSKTTFKILQQTKKIAAKVKNGVIKVTQVTRQGAKDAFNILAKKGGIDEVIAVVENGRLRVKKWVDARNNKKSISESIDGTHCVGETPKGDVGICLKNGACFVAGTPIYLANQFKPIEQINTLDTVQAGNPKNCEQALKGVEATFVRTTPVLVKLDFPLENIYATPEHPFFDLKNRQVLAGNIRKGDTLKTYDGYAIVQSARSIDTTATVYNFHVKDFHTYYVGKTKLWVHNMASHLADFGKRLATFKKLDDRFKKLTPKEQKAFAKDFGNIGDDILKQLDENPDLIGSWVILMKSKDIKYFKKILTKLDHVNNNLRNKFSQRATKMYGADQSANAWAYFDGIYYFDEQVRKIFDNFKGSNPNIKGERLIFGHDLSVRRGGLYPTVQGTLDIHMHGGRDGSLSGYFGHHLRDFATKKGFTVEELAEKINKDYAHLERIRFFVCYGKENAQKLANLTGKEVITSDDIFSFNITKGDLEVSLHGNIFIAKPD